MQPFISKLPINIGPAAQFTTPMLSINKHHHVGHDPICGPSQPLSHQSFLPYISNGLRLLPSRNPNLITRTTLLENSPHTCKLHKCLLHLRPAAANIVLLDHLYWAEPNSSNYRGCQRLPLFVSTQFVNQGTLTSASRERVVCIIESFFSLGFSTASRIPYH